MMVTARSRRMENLEGAVGSAAAAGPSPPRTAGQSTVTSRDCSV